MGIPSDVDPHGPVMGIAERMKPLKLELLFVNAEVLNHPNIREKIGSTLEDLHLVSNGSPGIAEEIGKIETYCRHIKKISIRIFSPSNSLQLAPALTKCLASYNQQLECATIRHLNPDQVKTVVESCKNARFKFKTHESDLSDYLKIFGKQVEAVKFPDYYSTDGEDTNITDA